MTFLPALLVGLAGCPDREPVVCGGAGVVCRLAGTGDRAFNGDGHDALETDFYLLSAARRGPDGLLYLMDFNNHRLRRVEANGTVSTIAGTGNHDWTVEGPATESPLENPVAFAFLPDGSITFVALHDPRVFVVDPDGMLRVIAGTGDPGDTGDGEDAREATFTELTGIVVGPDGSIFVSDGGAHRVRVIRPSGVVEAYAGIGAVPGPGGDGGPAIEANLWRPEGLALSEGGDLYVAEAQGHAVRRVRADGILETVAGTGEQGFSGDGGPAVEARLRRPAGVAVGPDGEVYVADTFNDCIRRVDPSGVIESIAGTGEEGLAGDGGPAIDADLYGPATLHFEDGALYFADQFNSVARVVYLP